MEQFKATFQSLRSHGIPQWFQDAKFGIWSHWGAQSVPMYGDWYARNMYVEGSPQYLYHLRHFGHPSKFGYKDVCALWKAENFDPDALMELYVKAGAKYFVAQAMHHDHFFNYPSALNPMNSQNIGPHKDIVGLWQAAAKKHNLPFGVTEHLGASFSWWHTNKRSDRYGACAGVPYDGNDPKYRAFYHNNFQHMKDDAEDLSPWYTENKEFHAYWLACMKELIDLYTPDLLYSDGGLPFGPDWTTAGKVSLEDSSYAEGLEAVSHLYNASIAKYGENRAIYNQKVRDPDIYRVGILDIERSQLDGIQEDPWQTDTCIGNWFYDVRQTFKRPDHIIDMLIDIVSKNGSMLLNILQRPDGTIDGETQYILTEIAKWFSAHAESIHGTKPWKRFGEGDTRVKIQGFTEDKAAWTSSDIRYTSKNKTVYAFLMGGARNHAAVLYSFNEGEQIRRVRLLGAGEVPFTQNFGVVCVQLPDILPTEYVNTLAIELA